MTLRSFSLSDMLPSLVASEVLLFCILYFFFENYYGHMDCIVFQLITVIILLYFRLTLSQI